MKLRRDRKPKQPSAKIRVTISINRDLKKKATVRMKEVGAASYSNYVDILMAADTGMLKRVETLAAA